MLIRLNNKQGTASIAIVLLVLLTVVLLTTSLFYFIIRDKRDTQSVYAPSFLKEIYFNEANINLYVQQIVDESSKNADSKAVFIYNFKKNLEKYKDKDGNFIVFELGQIDTQLVEKNIELVSNNHFKIKLDFVLSKELLNQDKKIFSAVYSYSKVFESNS